MIYHCSVNGGSEIIIEQDAVFQNWLSHQKTTDTIVVKTFSYVQGNTYVYGNMGMSLPTAPSNPPTVNSLSITHLTSESTIF